MFSQSLDRLGRRLDIPYPARALVLEELDGDLRSVYQELRAQGHDAPAARRRALQQLALDEASLADLEAIHNPAVRRAMRRLPVHSRTVNPASRARNTRKNGRTAGYP